MSISLTYAVRGTYWDGVVRHHHVTTDHVEVYAKSLTQGFLPFDRVEVRPCHNQSLCDGFDSWDHGPTFIIERDESYGAALRDRMAAIRKVTCQS